MSIYDRPAWQLLQEAIDEIGDTISTDDVIAWFQSKYPKINDKTVRQHLRAFSANDGTKQHMPHLPKNILFKTGRKAYTLYDPDRHGLFDEFGRAVLDEQDHSDIDDDTLLEPGTDLDFALELHLEEFIEKNWERIDFGRPLRLYSKEEQTLGRQYQTGIGTIDFLCEDTNVGDLVVVELKKGRTSDAVVGQCQRYMGWVTRHLAQAEQTVRGLIIVPEPDDRLTYALSVAPNIDLRCYKVDFELYNPPPELQS